MPWPTFEGNDTPTEYIPALNLLSSNGQAIESEIVAARDGQLSLTIKLGLMSVATAAAQASATAVTNEVVAARSGEASLLARLTAMVNALVAKAGLSANLPAAGYRITGLADGVSAQDAVTVAQASALLVGGGSPASIPITSLGIGTLTNADFVVRVGAAVVGVARAAIGVTEFGSGTVPTRGLVSSNGTAAIPLTAAQVRFRYGA